MLGKFDSVGPARYAELEQLEGIQIHVAKEVGGK